MERGNRPFVGAANLLSWAFAPGHMAFATGSAGLYNTISSADDNVNAVWNDPNASTGDLAKATYPVVFKTALDAAMIAAPVIKVATIGTMKANPGVLES